MDIKKNVGQKIQKFRKKKKITQEQLAEIINIETVSLSKIKTGRSYPTSENLAKISKILEVEPFEFFISENKSRLLIFTVFPILPVTLSVISAMYKTQLLFLFRLLLNKFQPLCKEILKLINKIYLYFQQISLYRVFR